jgi:hypothetical protein
MAKAMVRALVMYKEWGQKSTFMLARAWEIRKAKVWALEMLSGRGSDVEENFG